MKNFILLNILILFHPIVIFPQNSTHHLQLAWETEMNTGHGYPNSQYFDILLDEDGAIYATGNDFGAYGTTEAVIAKYDADGNVLWQQFFKGAGSQQIGIALRFDRVNQELNVLVQDENSAVNSRAYHIVKFTTTGELVSARRLALEEVEKHLIQQPFFDSAGNIYLLYGNRNSGTTQNGYLVKYANDGAVLWKNDYEDGNETVGSSICAMDPGGNIVVAAMERSYTSYSSTVLLYKFNADGEIIWQTQKEMSPNFANPNLRKITFDGESNITVCWDNTSYNMPSINALSFDSTGEEMWGQDFIIPDTDDLIELRDAYQTADGELYMIGDIRPQGLQIVKYDNKGVLQWERFVMHEKWLNGWKISFIPVDNNQILVSGITNPGFGGSTAVTGAFVYTLKSDGQYEILFPDSYNFNFGLSVFNTILVTRAGDYFACGADAGQRILKKYNPSGQVQWQITEGLSRVTNDHFLANTYNAQGETFLLSESAGDPVVTKFADDGTQLWQAIHSVGEPSYIVHKNIALNSKGEVYTLLTEGTDAGNFEDYLLRFSSRGTSSEKYPLTDLILWRSGQGIVIDENDAIYVMGSTKSNDLFYPALAKYDAQGNEIWRYVKSTDVGKWPEFILIELDPSNNLILLGRITEDSGLVSSNTVLTIEKLSKSGQVLWQKKWENPGKGTDYIQGLQTDHDGNIFFAVNSYFNYMEGNPVYYTAGIVKFSPGGKKLWDYLDQYDQNGEERLFGFSVDVFGNALFATANGSITKLNKDGDPVFRRDRTGLTEFQYFRLLNFEVDENANIYYNGFLYQLNETTYYGTKLSEGFTCLRPDGEVYWQNEGELSFGSFFINRIEQPNSLYNISTKGEYSARHIRLQKYDLGSDSTVVVTGDKVLLKAYPNPIRNATIIEYDLPQPAQVKVAVYDVLGRHVSTITNGAKEAGTHSEFWYPGGTADGNYFIVLKAGGKKAVCKVTYLK